MKITKRQLRRIIKEEKAKILKEADPATGLITDDEDDDRVELLMRVELQLNELIQYVVDEAERIGGGFRSPGIKLEAFTLMADMVNSYRNSRR